MKNQASALFARMSSAVMSTPSISSAAKRASARCPFSSSRTSMGPRVTEMRPRACSSRHSIPRIMAKSPPSGSR